MTSHGYFPPGFRVGEWRRTGRRPLWLAAVLVALTLVAAACGGTSASKSNSSSQGGAAPSGSAAASPGKPHYGGNLVVGLEADWHPIDPLTGLALDDGGVQSAVYNSLFDLTATDAVQPELATGFTVSANGLSYTLTLRQGVNFQDGTPFNAQAVVFNLERDLNPANHCGCLSALAPIQSVTATGPYTVAVTLKSPYADLPTVLGGFSGMMVSPTAVAKYGATYPLHPVGTGPFEFQSEVVGHSVTFTRWPGYWQKGLPYLNSVTFESITNPSASYASLVSGSIQDAENLSATEFKEAQTNPNVKIQTYNGSGTVFTMMQVQQAPFNNRLARLAVAYATNSAQLNKDLPICQGLCPPVESPFTPAMWAYPGANVPGYPAYNLAKARALVKQLGGLSFTMAIQAANPATLEYAEAEVSQWAQAGIQVSLTQQDQVTLINNATNGNFQAMLFRWQGGFDPDQNVYQFFHCGSSLNNVHMCDPQLDKLLDAGRAPLSQSARKAIYGQVAQRLAYDMPYDFLYYSVWKRLMSLNLHGVAPLPNDWFVATNAWLS